MANRQTYVVGALGVLLGMVVGVGSSQQAQTVSYSGHNPNNTVIQDMDHLRRASDYLRIRGEETHYSAPRTTDLAERAEYRGRLRAEDESITIRGLPISAWERMVGDCYGLSRSRLTHCIVETLQGNTYQLRQTSY